MYLSGISLGFICARVPGCRAAVLKAPESGLAVHGLIAYI